ncbi:hypothetical protein [Paracoccus spongiarum]|uniref:Uncharacterized protein n=1 Tax=Paracoccus spongiarum TaxID=3064387 RepID=A0ABT9J8H7_9RHOB|nr:hypothetical protein [Paracoccus sp. 2205BS29-5]MDP5306101.1 hypothetical protein [Paracoccus sp. 2205BS29-5]
MIAKLGIAALVTLLAVPASAQMDDGELQRCIWRCLADSPGAASQQYNACVRRLCEGPAPARPAGPSWGHVGRASGGGQMASITVGASTLAFSCERGKPALLAIEGLPGPSRGIAVTVDGRPYRADFASRRGVHYTAIPAGSPLLAALLAGSSVQLRNPGGNSVSTFPLAGSSRAIGTAMARCGMRG